MTNRDLQYASRILDQTKPEIIKIIFYVTIHYLIKFYEGIKDLPKITNSNSNRTIVEFPVITLQKIQPQTTMKYQTKTFELLVSIRQPITPF